LTDVMSEKDPIETVRSAINEVRQHREQFSDSAFAAIMVSLLDRIRRLQTLPTPNYPPAAPLSDEIRLVTVLFVDVKDSTTLAQRMDTSDFKNLIAESHRRIAILVSQYEGTIGQYLGDGVLIFFGAQRSRGDDALRAVACALAIKQSVDSYANMVFLQHGLEFGVRMGISTGRLVVGMVGAESKKEFLALGPATNLAARLQVEAPPGGIFVDSATYNRVRSQFDVKPRPMARMKGYDELVAIYEVLGRIERATMLLASTTVADLPVPLAGRDDVLGEIGHFLRKAYDQSRLACLMMVGDLGLGKTRILHEVIDSAPEYYQTALMLAWAETRTNSLSLMSYFLASYCNLTDDMPTEVMQQQIVQTITEALQHPDAQSFAEVLGYLGGFGFEGSPFVNSLLSGGNRAQTVSYRWVSRFFRALMQSTGLGILLVVDNLEWADADSVDMLQYMAQDLQDMPMVILCASRPTYQLLYPNFMGEVNNYHLLELQPLSSDVTRKMIDNILQPIQRVPPMVTDVIAQRADGNPLFVMEFLEMMFDARVFQRTNTGAWRFNLVLYDSVFKTLPAGLVEVVQSRLDELTNMARQVVQLAAVTGQTFWSGIISELLGIEATATLDNLIKRSIITPSPESVFEGELQYSFRHSLYREVAYEMLPRNKREAYHHNVADWLISRVNVKPDYLPMLANHYELSNNYSTSIFIYVEAVQNRLQRGMMTEVLTLVERALSLTGHIPRDVALGVSVQLWTAQAEALYSLSRYQEVTAVAITALRLFEELPDDGLMATRVNASRLLGMAHINLGQYEDAAIALEQAYNWIDENNTAQMGEVLRAYGMLSLQRGRVEDAISYQMRAVKYAEDTGDSRLLVTNYAHAGVTVLERGYFADARDYFDRCFKINSIANYIRYEAIDLRRLASVYMLLDCYDFATPLLEKGIEHQTKVGEIDTLMSAYWELCIAHYGKVDEALTHMQMLNLQPHRDKYVGYQVWLSLIEMYILAGNYENAILEAQRFMHEIALINHMFHARAMLLLGRAKALAKQADAVDLLQMGVAWEKEYGGRELWRGYAWLAQASSGKSAKQYYQQSAEYIQAILEQFDNQKELQEAFLASPLVQEVLSHQ
jgi:class 3 adenylate cyclase/tetratricopeptide (TPR) repeat protein